MELSEVEMSKKNSNSFLPIAILVVVLAFAAYFLFGRNDEAITTTISSPAPDSITSVSNTESATRISPTNENITGVGQVKEIEVNGSDMSFDPSTISVKKGDTVRIVLNNTDSDDEMEITHDFVIDEFNVQSDEIGEGESTTFEFVADKIGEFEYYCSIGKHREYGMYGALVVTE